MYYFVFKKLIVIKLIKLRQNDIHKMYCHIYVFWTYHIFCIILLYHLGFNNYKCDKSGIDMTIT